MLKQTKQVLEVRNQILNDVEQALIILNTTGSKKLLAKTLTQINHLNDYNVVIGEDRVVTLDGSRYDGNKMVFIMEQEGLLFTIFKEHESNRHMVYYNPYDVDYTDAELAQMGEGEIEAERRNEEALYGYDLPLFPFR